MLIEEVDYLKQWLITQLQAISEADPSVLAKYVIALLKKDDSFNQETFIEQLEVFLDDATVPFVRNLYEVLESKEYLPIPPKKKRVFTEAPSPQEEVKSSDRKVSIEPPAKTTEQRLVELSMHPVGEDDKMGTRKRRFDDERPQRKRGSRNNPREESDTRTRSTYNAQRDEADVRTRSTYNPQREEADTRTRSTYNAQREEADVRVRYNADNEDNRSRGDNRRYNDRAERHRPEEHNTRLEMRGERYSRAVHERVGYPKRRYSPEEHRRYSRSPSRSPPRRSRSPPRRSRSPRSPRKSLSPARNGKSRKERCRDFDEKGYCLRGGLCQYDHGTDPVVVEESNLSTVLQAAQTPGIVQPAPHVHQPPAFSQAPIFPPGETYNPDKPGIMNNLTVPQMSSMPLPPPPPVSAAPAPPIITTAGPEHNKRPYAPSVRRTPSSTGQPRSFKLVDGIDIITGATAPITPDQTTLIIRDIPFLSNDGALLSRHLGAFGPIRHLHCKVYNDNHTAIVDYHTHASALACFNSTEALLNHRFIKVFWKEVIPISLAPAYFNTANKPAKPTIHQSMNLVNTTTTAAATVTTTNNESEATPVVMEKPPPPKITPLPSYQHREKTKAMFELARQTQELLDQNLKSQKLIVSRLEKCKDSTKKREFFTTLKKLQESHNTIKSRLTSMETGLGGDDRKRKTPRAPPTTRGANTNLDLRPREILVKNCNNAEELQEHFSKFGSCTVIPSGVGVIIGFDKRKDAEMAYVKGRIVDNQELDIEWNKSSDTVQSPQVTVEPIR